MWIRCRFRCYALQELLCLTFRLAACNSCKCQLIICRKTTACTFSLCGYKCKRHCNRTGLVLCFELQLVPTDLKKNFSVINQISGCLEFTALANHKNCVPHQLPQQSMYTQYHTLEVDTASAKSSTSCPPLFQGEISPPTHMSDEERRLWAKDRQKKDNHNMSEFLF